TGDATITAIDFDPDSKRLATGSESHLVRIWDLETQRLERAFSAPGRSFRSLGLVGGFLTIVSDPSTYEVYNIQKGLPQILTRDLETQEPVTSFKLDDDKQVFSAVSLWNEIYFSTSKGEIYCACGDPSDYKFFLHDIFDSPFNAFAFGHVAQFAPEYYFFAAGTSGTVLMIDMHGAGSVGTLTDHDSWIYTLAFSPDSHILASAGCSKTIDLAYNYGSQMYMSCEGADLRLWDFYDIVIGAPMTTPYFGKQIITSASSIHTMPIRKMAFNADGTLLITASDDGTLVLWGVPADTQSNPPQ
ncbi:MAG TPA: hypothetical protein VHL11_21310, partial [Phototrophicaceae bacterium]|nr:hypothetical protein [Phototrophicaceae bacterium]